MSLSLAQGNAGGCFVELSCGLVLDIVSIKQTYEGKEKEGEYACNGAVEQLKYSKSGYLNLVTTSCSANNFATAGTILARVARLSCINRQYSSSSNRGMRHTYAPSQQHMVKQTYSAYTCDRGGKKISHWLPRQFCELLWCSR